MKVPLKDCRPGSGSRTDAIARDEICSSFPLCGALAGLYARTGGARGVWKAPANVRECEWKYAGAGHRRGPASRTQSVVFEPNNDRLWAQVRLNVGGIVDGQIQE